MNEKTLQIGLYRILRKMGIPREEVAFEADFDKDYFFSNSEKNMIFNFVEYKYNLIIPKMVENNAHNINYLMNYIKQQN